MASVQRSYLAGSHHLAMGGSGGEPGEWLCGVVAVTSAVTGLSIVAGYEQCDGRLPVSGVPARLVD
jgi:hypothetical protein